MKVLIKKLNSEVEIPLYKTKGAAGFDIASIEDVDIYPGDTRIVKTGLSFKIPEGYELQIRPRSGISSKTNLRIANSPGTIDSDYIGEVCIIIDNINTNCDKRIPYSIKKGDRIAQGVICQITQAEFYETEDLPETERGDRGFGHTG
jgi:dUTP pyrophosphatase